MSNYSDADKTLYKRHREFRKEHGDPVLTNRSVFPGLLHRSMLPAREVRIN